MHLRALLVLCLTGCTTQDLATMIDGDDPPANDALTYYRDVMPLVQQHCASCHAPGGIGPFSMLTYEDTKAHAAVISSYVSAGLMPPWKPADGCRDLKGARKLTQAEKDVFTGWANGRAAAGDPADAPPTQPGATGLATVDATMQMAAAYTPPAGETDHYQCFILDPKLVKDEDLIGYTVHPGTAAEVHHVLLFPAALADAKKLDDANTDEVGWTCFGGPGVPNAQMIGGWVPGSSAVVFPTDTGIELKAGQIIVMQVHYNMGYTQAAPDQSTVDFMYAKAPVAKHATVQGIRNTTFAVPPGAKGYAVKATQKGPAGGTIWGLAPHAHTNAQQMHVDSDAGCLIDIPAWDFHWQQFYFFDQPVRFTAGQQVQLTCTYDNPGAAPLTWGENTSDEMCLNYFYVTP